MTADISIVGMACRYPDAPSPSVLWDNVLAGRRAFRRLPEGRIRLGDYFSSDRNAPDRFYAATAAVLDGYEFDRVAFRVAGSTFRSTDLAHWLALDVAAEALADAGFPGGAGLATETTGVVVGNTLTSEFSRANTLRLRWPYVRRVLFAALEDDGLPEGHIHRLLGDVERRFKEPFPPVDGDTLAGALSNTIAGRICNHFDLGGGGYTIDGACSSSLLSVTTACTGLASGDLDVAIAGGVDLSLDPFELVGFAKAGALANTDMRVYDRHSAGFWPGEGCGMVVLMRAADAAAQNRRTYARIRGWGVSSDGGGGITRPEADGQLLAVTRAYRRAGFTIDTVGYFEGHGTGTVIGDETELTVLTLARRDAHASVPAALGSVKANIGHTKAAAGVAGLMKATLAVQHRTLPPTTGCVEPHALLGGDEPLLRVLPRAERWPGGDPARAAVSSMGFGGINVHLVIEEPDRLSPPQPAVETMPALQDTELFLLDAASSADLAGQARRLATAASTLSYAELTDLAASLRERLGGRTVRAALVAGTPAQLAERLGLLLDWLDAGTHQRVDPKAMVCLGSGHERPSIAYLFPGQGTGARATAEALLRRFPAVAELYAARGPGDVDDAGTDVATDRAQPRIVTASLAALRALRLAGVEATTAVGHSLGELTALHWADAIDAEGLVQLARVRGRLMVRHSAGGGAMASLAAAPADVATLLVDEPVVIACYNGPRLTVVSGESAAVERVVLAAGRRGIAATRLPVSHAFHSPLLARAGAAFAAHLANQSFRPLRRKVVSTVTGAPLDTDVDLRELLQHQITEPVRFSEAARTVAADADLLIEVGPGTTLSRFVRDETDTPAVAVVTDSFSLTGYLSAVAAAFALGHPVRTEALFRDRFVRPIVLERERRFLHNPCESPPPGPVEQPSSQDAPPGTTAPDPATGAEAPSAVGTGSALDTVRNLVAAQAELPVEAVAPSDHLLDDLHLSSITIGQIVVEACQQLGKPPPAAVSTYATATVAEVAEALDTSGAEGSAQESDRIDGLGAWIRPFAVAMEAQPSVGGPPAPSAQPGRWQVFAPDGHAMVSPLAEALGACGDGVLLCADGEVSPSLLLRAARAARDSDRERRLVVVGTDAGAAALAKTLHLEEPTIPTTVVATSLLPERIGRIVTEVAATTGFTEVAYDDDGTRRIPVLRVLPTADAAALPLTGDDVLLVTGGGKGITAECALALARESGARLALLGRSDPGDDPALAQNLRRVAASGTTFRYVRADVTDVDAVAEAIADAEAALGTVTGVLHGAGHNVPQLLATLTEEAFEDASAPKVAGLQAVLQALDPDALRLLVTFGSIIGRAGLRGEAAYAVANARLRDLTERFAAKRPDCRCLALEWSVWSGVGMGDRLGAAETLVRDGVTPIGVDEGVRILHDLLAMPDTPTTVVITGRFAGMRTVRGAEIELPLGRFLERPRVHYPGVELVADADLSTTTDPYLDDHVLDGQRVVPGVMAMEALAQAAMAVAGRQHPPALEGISFLRPTVVAASGRTTVRVAAMVTGQDTVELALRSDDSKFEVDHVRAVGNFAPQEPPAVPFPGGGPDVPLSPSRDLYGGLLFQSGRFHRIDRYRLLRATDCVAEIRADDQATWFGPFLPSQLSLGNPGTRDACLHAVQCCVPTTRLVPVAVARFVPFRAAPGSVTVHATERSHEGDEYSYDLTVVGADGGVTEAWQDVRFRALRGRPATGVLPPALVGCVLERGLSEFAAISDITVATDPASVASHQDRRPVTQRAIARALGRRVLVLHRPDGRPEVPGAFTSAAHGGTLVLAVVAHRPVACDAEPVVDRPSDVWEGLVGPGGLLLARSVAEATGEPMRAALTRVWSAYECVRKLGRWSVEPCAPLETSPDGWVLLGIGPQRVATWVTDLTGPPLTFAVLAEGEDTTWMPTSTTTLSASRRPTSSATSTS